MDLHGFEAIFHARFIFFIPDFSILLSHRGLWLKTFLLGMPKTGVINNRNMNMNNPVIPCYNLVTTLIYKIVNTPVICKDRRFTNVMHNLSQWEARICLLPCALASTCTRKYSLFAFSLSRWITSFEKEIVLVSFLFYWKYYAHILHLEIHLINCIVSPDLFSCKASLVNSKELFVKFWSSCEKSKMAFKSVSFLLALYLIAFGSYILSSSSVDATITPTPTATAEPTATAAINNTATPTPESSASTSLLPSFVQMFCLVLPAILYYTHWNLATDAEDQRLKNRNNISCIVW